MTYLLLALLLFPVALLGFGLIGSRLATGSQVTSNLEENHAKPGHLYVLVHGMAPKEQRWNAIRAAIKPHGHVLQLSYPAAPYSNADPRQIALGIGAAVSRALVTTKAKRITFISHSMGALLTRQAILDAREHDWVKAIQRVVFLAGVNRGWDIGGTPPADADPLERFAEKVLCWGARMVNLSELVLSFERGSPFVANLRLRWMKWVRDTNPDIEIVQMLGDIDDVVSREDNEDLRVIDARKSKFTQLIVRGTGHGEIVDIATDVCPEDERRLHAYRRDKLVSAATADFSELLAANEAQPFTTNDEITELVFILHGIRDLGRWSTKFEEAIHHKYPDKQGTLRVVAPRYGYFGMGPFLFEGVRKRYVRWFMDEYTATLARYPAVANEKIRFFGHSNGTYLLADALSTYDSMEIDRVVFAGSVVPTQFDWTSLTKGDQRTPRVRAVRNYVGTEDWVVAFFPRLFELPVVSALFRNPIGSAGFNGFDREIQQPLVVENVRFVRGQHSAYEGRIDEIVEYLMGNATEAGRDDRSWAGVVMSSPVTVAAVWLTLIFLVVSLGARVVAASPQPVWPVLLAYVLLVVMILRTV